MDFTLSCMEIIECIINREDISLTDTTIHSIFKEYTKNNMIKALKHINKEFKRLNLCFDEEYMKAYNRLKEILKNIEELKEVYQYSTVINKKSFLTICNKHHHSKKYFTLSKNNDVHILSICDKQLNYTWIQSYDDIWNSKKNDVIIALDNSNNAYKFIFINGKYVLKQAYTINNKNLLKGITYKTILGRVKVIS